MADPYKGTPYEGLDPLFAARIKAMVDDSGGRLAITSGFRSVERQERLWNEAVRKYGSAAAARKWVAPPGKSNHGKGTAVDLRFNTDEARTWAHQNAAKYGLFFPMGHEPWHIETIKTALEENWNPDAYTDPPIGEPPAGDPTDPGFQMIRMLAMMDQDLMSQFGSGELDPMADTSGAMQMMGAAGGQVDDDQGASMQAFGFTEDPYLVRDGMEEQGLGDD